MLTAALPPCHYCQQRDVVTQAAEQLCGLWTCAACRERIYATPLGVWRIFMCMRAGIRPMELPVDYK